jgi:predicted DsbA family dithiol-disulfide isomerase
LLRHAREHSDDNLDVEWRYLSLEQINNKHGDDWKVWEQPESYPMRGRLAFKGAEAARKQGDDAFDNYHLALLKARHVEGKELTDRETIFGAARDAGLDMDRFTEDFESATLDELGKQHEAGVSKHGVFGCPTIVFDGSSAGYLKLRPLPPDEELLKTWEQVKAIIHGRPEIAEIKRPVAPRG